MLKFDGFGPILGLFHLILHTFCTLLTGGSTWNIFYFHRTQAHDDIFERRSRAFD